MLFVRWAIFATLLGITHSGISAPAPWTENQWSNIQQLWIKHRPAKPALDPSNTYQYHPEAIEFGKKLFFDRRLSKDGNVSCSHCHQAKHHFTDRQQHALGLQKGKRNTPSLMNAGYQNWFFWDGRSDSLWSQALGPLENKNEHGVSRVQVVKFIANNPDYRSTYLTLFGPLPAQNMLDSLPIDASPLGSLTSLKSWKVIPKTQRFEIDKAFSNIGKSIAAYVNTLISGPTRFDQYVENRVTGKTGEMLDELEIHGLKIFVSKNAGCTFCHSGPLLTNGGFHNIGTGVKGWDTGRSEVVEQIPWDRFNCLGRFSDAKKHQCDELSYMSKDRHDTFGTFKVPSLRGIADTAPYMHDGRFHTLEDAISHYNKASESQDTHLPPIKLTEEDVKALAAFLGALQ